jgi:hypothetical protein
MARIMEAKRIQLIGALFLCALSPLFAAENHWTGADANSYSTNKANWSLGTVPDLTQDVSIDQTGANPVIFITNATAKNFSHHRFYRARIEE